MRPTASPQYMKHHGISPSFGLSKFLRTLTLSRIRSVFVFLRLAKAENRLQGP